MSLITPLSTNQYVANPSVTQYFEADMNTKKKKYKDPLQNYPLRLLGYTNDIGVAINELFPKFATMCWVPALMYFGADIYDKYKNKGNKYDPNQERGFKQAVFQANASILMPMMFGHIGQSAFSLTDKFVGAKLSTNAKEQALRYIKHHAASERIFEADQVEDIYAKFSRRVDNLYSNTSKSYKKKSFAGKVFDTLLNNCKKGAIPHSNEARFKDYIKTNFKQLVESTSSLEELEQIIDKKIFKLKAWKSAGAFTALFLTMKFIDNFTENVLIKKLLEPGISKIKSQNYKSLDNFMKTKENEKAKHGVKQ